MTFEDLEYKPEKPTRKVIDQIGQWEVYKDIFWKDNIKLGLQKTNPLREDHNPSFSLFISKQTGDILWYDFATGESGDCIKLLRLVKNLSYRDALASISNSHIPDVYEYEYKKRTLPKSKKVLITSTAINAFDYPSVNYFEEYWKQYLIEYNEIDSNRNFTIEAVRDVYINNKLFVGSTKNNPIFKFTINPSFREKYYRPYATDWKHFGNVTKNDVWSIKRSSVNGGLIITKSVKDLLVLSTMFTNSSVIAFQSENMFPDEDVLSEFIGGHRKITVCFDMDEAGIKGRDKLIAMLKNMGHTNLFAFYDLPYKDISDSVKETKKSSFVYYFNCIKPAE